MTNYTLTTVTRAFAVSGVNSALLKTSVLTASPGADPIVTDDNGAQHGSGLPGTLFSLAPKIAGSKQAAVAADSLRLAYGEPLGTLVWNLTSGVGISETVSPGVGVDIFDGFNLSATDAPSAHYVKTLSDIAKLQESLSFGLPVNLAETLGITAAINVARGQLLQETMRFAQTDIAAAKYGIALLDAFQLQDSLFNFFNGVLSDAIGMASALTVKFRPTAAVGEAIGIRETVNPVLLFGMELDDTIRLSHTELLKTIFDGHIHESLNLRVAYAEPGGFTTWAVNTRTGAVTEYENYVFNSFAKMRHHYLGANDKGLFLMDGPRDVTDNIPTHVKTGKFSTGSKFTTITSAYLGLSLVDDDASQDFFLKMVAGDGREYVYKIKPNPEGMTTKVNMGKGLRSRYFSFELISTGADWDLDGLEFIPIVSKRRV